uniref:Cns1/TTC4 wheel domain-containing protein n=1 Tax=Glossina austeni TaxID=7395 RepID=A0A1A9VJD6_GLOAU
MSLNNSKDKQEWTEQDRLELAAKLDAELDEFIDGLEKKRYEEGWPEDRWQEEMEKHPFFMRKAPQPGDEVHPMLAGLQKLKYDPEENTKEELALNYKEDGNFYMKHKKFRMAVYSFTEGLKVNCDNDDVQATLYNNRSAAQFFLKNYRSALADAQTALSYKPDYVKALWRAAQCASHLQRFDLCAQLCEDLLDHNSDHQMAKELLKKNSFEKMETARNHRKQLIKAKRDLEEFHRLKEALEERQVKFECKSSITMELIKPKFSPLEDFPVHLDDEDQKTLIWPAAFSYPEFLFSDFQQQLSEEVTMFDCLTSMFAEPLPQDKGGQYFVDNLNVYYENRKLGTVHKVDLEKTIKEIMKEKSFFITGGALLFYVVPKDSQIEKEFLNTQRRGTVYS